MVYLPSLSFLFHRFADMLSDMTHHLVLAGKPLSTALVVADELGIPTSCGGSSGALVVSQMLLERVLARKDFATPVALRSRVHSGLMGGQVRGLEHQPTDIAGNQLLLSLVRGSSLRSCRR